MEQEILKPWQIKVIELVAQTSELNNFYLTGGTALAGFYLHHRISDDLDFFSFEDFDKVFIHHFAVKIKELLDSSEVNFSRLFDRSQFFFKAGEEEYKVEFTKYPFEQIKESAIINKLRVDSEKDIAINKLMTIVDRFDPKDFADMYFLLQKYPLKELREGVQKKFKTNLDPIVIGSAFVNVKRIVALPKMTKALTIEELKDFFSNEANKLSPEVLE